jgi:hypothetical protein
MSSTYRSLFLYPASLSIPGQPSLYLPYPFLPYFLLDSASRVFQITAARSFALLTATVACKTVRATLLIYDLLE